MAIKTQLGGRIAICGVSVRPVAAGHAFALVANHDRLRRTPRKPAPNGARFGWRGQLDGAPFSSSQALQARIVFSPGLV
ncbi:MULTISPECIES: hypothetical protein [unclassified Caballeronia]|uniref:hypothetical protein n=1 Tax=unclassified Caballeronia TaxID=2646786 RepID=UPI0028556F0D|nr:MULTISPECIES: hypothetical protein [unclassified Caballeronia]MDR5755167.1 hypothetical protein [Caballeronia sp. LZ024]MDR5845359.1 hypothetical protein [Caballeronia sp. LZ031]